MANLDYVAAECGQELGYGACKEKANDINAALDVLHRNGVYALFLWLHESKGKRRAVGRALNTFLHHDDIKSLAGNPDTHEKFYGSADAALKNVRTRLTTDLGRMMAVKNLMSRMLTYSRHAAKIAVTPTTEQTTTAGGANEQ